MDPLDDDALWLAFEQRAIPAAQWTHAAHLRVAWLHLARYSLDEAHLRLRVGIIRLNTVHGLVETPQRGYHETLTRVWLILVADQRARASVADSSAFVAGRALAPSLPLDYYTRHRLFSVEARARFVEPDIAPLPALDP